MLIKRINERMVKIRRENVRDVKKMSKKSLKEWMDTRRLVNWSRCPKSWSF